MNDDWREGLIAFASNCINLFLKSRACSQTAVSALLRALFKNRSAFSLFISVQNQTPYGFTYELIFYLTLMQKQYL